MTTIYIIIVAFLLLLAVFDLFVGVSNDAVNFLNSAIGAKVAPYRTVLIIASLGVLFGAIMSAGMMDIARHGILRPDHYSFSEVMTIFLAVMVADVVILDMFNTLGMPTSTTVSMVFELLGGTFVFALIKMHGDSTLSFDELLNTEKALSVIIAIFVSVALAFASGMIVEWIARLIFTFNYKKHLKYTIAVFGGIAFTSLAYFIFIKGLGKSPFISDDIKTWIDANTKWLMIVTLLISSVMMEALHLLHVNVFKLIVLLGTFALAMAFAGNDLVNFIGVPLAGLDSLQDFMANGNGDYDGFMMVSLMESAKSPFIYLVAAGLIMIISMATSKKAQNVVKTSVGLSKQDEGDEMFGSSRVARSLVRASRDLANATDKVLPKNFTSWVDTRFNKSEVILAKNAAFDEVRAAVNLVIAAMLIIIGTNYKLPLSTTYVTFMVAMGSSLADRAWGRESAVFRITGMFSVIGGWFITAGIAFAASGLVCFLMHIGGFPVMIAFMLLDAWLLWRSNNKYKKKLAEEEKNDKFQLMMSAQDKDFVWAMLSDNISSVQSDITRFICDKYNDIVKGLEDEDIHKLRNVEKEIKHEREMLKKQRRQQLLAMKRIPSEMAMERNTWYHLGINSDSQLIYCLLRMLEPIKEHVDNNFMSIPKKYMDEYEPVRNEINGLMKNTETMIASQRYDLYDSTLKEADDCKEKLSAMRNIHINRMQSDPDNGAMKTSLLYLNLIQESQELLSVMRHQLRAARKFLEI